MPVNLGSAYGSVEIGTEGAQKNISSLSQQLSQTGKALSLGVTAPLVGVAAMAIKSAGDFEQSLNVMAQVSGATAEQMAAVQAQALEMGAVTSFSAGEAAEAQLELAKAGLSVQQVLDATPGVMDLAAAGGLDLAQAAEIAANAMNAFNLPASEMPGIANMLAAAANASSVDVTDLAAAMKMSGAVFAANKQPMDDMVTALAMLGNAGLKGSDAGTSLKTMMLSLAAPTDAALKNLTDMNVAVYDSAGNMRGFSDIMNDLSIATSKMNDEQRNVALSTIFGSDAIRAASIITRDYGKSWDDISDALGNESAAADVANARMSGMTGAIEYLKGSIDSFLIGAALPFLASLSGIVRVVADAITAIGALPEPVRNAALAFAAVMAAAGPIMLAIPAIGAAFAALTAPVGLVVLALAGLAAAWTMDLGGIQGITAQAIGAVMPMFQSMQTAIVGLLPAVSSLGFAFSNMGAVLADAGAGSIEAEEALRLFPAALQPVITAAQQLWIQFAAIAAQLQAFFAPAVARVQEAFVGLPASLAPLMPKLTELGAAFASLVTSLQPFLQLIGAGLAIAVAFGINAFAAVIANLPGIVGPIIDQVTASINLVSTVLTEVVTMVKAIINGDWATVWDSAKTITQAFVTFYRDSILRFSKITETVFKAIYDAVVNTLTDLGVDVGPIMDGIKSAWETAWNAIKDALAPVKTAVEGVQDAIEGFSSWIGGITFANPFQPLADAANTAMSAAGQFFGGGGGNAVGTNYAKGGLTMVGERGPEAVVLPTGSRVLTNGQTNNMGGQGGPTINVNLGGVTVNKDMDIQRIGWGLANQIAAALG